MPRRNENSSNRSVRALLASLGLAMALTVAPAQALADELGTTDDQLSYQPTEIVEETTVDQEAIVREAPEQEPQDVVVPEVTEGSVTEVATDETQQTTTDDQLEAVETPETTDAVQEDEQAVDEAATMEDPKDEVAEAPEAEATETAEEEPLTSAANNWRFAEGYYSIETNTNAQMVLVPNGTKVQTVAYADNPYKWYFWHGTDANTYYITTTKTLGSNYLNSSPTSNACFIAAKGAGSLWNVIVDPTYGYYYIQSVLNGKYINVQKGQKTAGANIVLYDKQDKNDGVYLLPEKAQSVAGAARTLADGAFVLTTYSDTERAIDVQKNSLDNNASIINYTRTGGENQRCFFTYNESTGFYTINIVSSGKLVTVSANSRLSDNNVIQYSDRGNNTQKWMLQKFGSAYVFVNAATGLALTRSGNNIVASAFCPDGADMQKFMLVATNVLTPGIYEIQNRYTPTQVVDVAKNSSASDAKIEIYTDNDGFNQRFELEHIGFNKYRIRTASSGGYLTETGTANGSKVIQQGNSKTAVTEANTWQVVWNGEWWSLKNMASGRVLDTTGSKVEKGQQLVVKDATKGLRSQYYKFVPANLIEDGYYTLLNCGTSTYLDIASNSTADGGNAIVYKGTGGNNQMFYIYKSGKGYRLQNIYSSKMLDVKGASKDDYANVAQWKWTGGTNQLWDMEIGDGGGVVFVNRNSGKVLYTTGSNVCQAEQRGYARENWKLTKASPYGWAANGSKWYFYYKNGDRTSFTSQAKYAWERIKTWSSPSKYYIVIDNNVDNPRTFVFQGSANKWEPLYDWNCAVGMYPGPDRFYGITPRGHLEILRKGYMMADEAMTTCEYYWCEFKHNDTTSARFHSAIYHYNTMNIADGRTHGVFTHGCVRLAIENAKFIYDYCPVGTPVYSYPAYSGGKFPTNNPYPFPEKTYDD